MKCDHSLENVTSSLVRVHPHNEPRHRDDGSVYDEYECENCHAVRVAAERTPDGVSVAYDGKGRRIVSVLSGVI